MRVESEVAICALDDGHGAGLAGRQAASDVAGAPSPDRVWGAGAFLARKVKAERIPVIPALGLLRK
jgi:hypothetical protein